jgi:hypothetical protein
MLTTLRESKGTSAFNLAATKCCDKSLEFVLMKNWYIEEDAGKWMLNGGESVSVDRVRSVLSYAAILDDLSQDAHLSRVYEKWALERRCQLVDLVTQRLGGKFGRTLASLQYMTAFENVDDWCDHCRGAIFGNCWTMKCHDTVIVLERLAEVCYPHTRDARRSLITPSTPCPFIIRPRLLELAEMAIENNTVGTVVHSAALDLAACMHPQILAIFKRFFPGSLGKRLVSHLVRHLVRDPDRGGCHSEMKMSDVVLMAKEIGFRDNYETLKLMIGVGYVRDLLESGGLDIVDADRESALADFMKIPQLTWLISRQDMEAPAGKKRESRLKFVLNKSKQLDAHMSIICAKYPDVFYTCPDALTFIVRNRRLASKCENFARVRRDVILGISTALLLGNNDPDCALSILDGFCLRSIIRRVLGYRE